MKEQDLSDIIYNKLCTRKFAKENAEGIVKTHNNANVFGELFTNLEEVNKYWSIQDEFNIISHRKNIGKIIVTCKKILRKLLRWYIKPIVVQQNMYNSYNTKTLNCIKVYLESINQENKGLKESIEKLTNSNINNLEHIKSIDNFKNLVEELKKENSLLKEQIEKLSCTDKETIIQMKTDINTLKFALNRNTYKFKGNIDGIINRIKNVENEIYEIRQEKDTLIKGQEEIYRKLELNNNFKFYADAILNMNEEVSKNIENTYSLNGNKQVLIDEEVNSEVHRSKLLNDFIDKSTLENEEYNIFKNININALSTYIEEDKTVNIIGHYGYLLKGDKDKIRLFKPIATPELLTLSTNNKINKNEIVFHPLALNNILEKSDTTLVLNPFLSNMILVSNCIESICHKINSKLILIMSLPTHEITKTISSEINVLWDNEFSDTEVSNDVFFRWQHGKNKKTKITIVNNTNDIIYSNISWKTQIIQQFGGNLRISLNDKKIMYKVEYNSQLDINLDAQLNIGNNYIYIEYYGQSVKVDNDDRLFNFTVSDFSILNKSINKLYEKECVYCNEMNKSDAYYFSDKEIREKLHKNGFFEVTAEVYFNNALYHSKLDTSRYLFPEGMYIYDKKELNDNDLIEETYLTVVYTAYRFGRYDDEVK